MRLRSGGGGGSGRGEGGSGTPLSFFFFFFAGLGGKLIGIEFCCFFLERRGMGCELHLLPSLSLCLSHGAR